MRPIRTRRLSFSAAHRRGFVRMLTVPSLHFYVAVDFIRETSETIQKPTFYKYFLIYHNSYTYPILTFLFSLFLSYNFSIYILVFHFY